MSILVEIIVLLNILSFICLLLFVLFQNEASVPLYFSSYFVCNHRKKELVLHYYTNSSVKASSSTSKLSKRAWINVAP